MDILELAAIIFKEATLNSTQKTVFLIAVTYNRKV